MAHRTRKKKGPAPTDPRIRFWNEVAGVQDPAGCWLWTGFTTRQGYGKFFQSAELGKCLAHRWAYEHLVGEIPGGLTLDHLCYTPACVNPAHLEPVTLEENIRRAAERRRAMREEPTHCAKGHPYTDQTLYVTPAGRLTCRICRRVNDSRRYYRHRAKRPTP